MKLDRSGDAAVDMAAPIKDRENCCDPAIIRTAVKNEENR
jgi:hypothetical protein